MTRSAVSIKSSFWIVWLLLFAVSLFAQNEVVVYVSQDRTVAEPILRSFEGDQGVRVIAVYDSEESGGTSLIDRLIQEKDRPKADVFWASDPVQQITLKEKGVLEAYPTVNGQAIRYPYKDLESYWFGFSGRAFVIVLNKTRWEAAQLGLKPQSILGFVDPKRKGLGAISEPLFGTGAVYAAVLFYKWGDSRTIDFFHELKKEPRIPFIYLEKRLICHYHRPERETGFLYKFHCCPQFICS